MLTRHLVRTLTMLVSELQPHRRHGDRTDVGTAQLMGDALAAPAGAVRHLHHSGPGDAGPAE